MLIGQVTDDTLEINLWLMSCRVLNREMELAMFDALVEQCQARGIRKIIGIYIPSKKNSVVADHYLKLGFAGERKAVKVPKPGTTKCRITQHQKRTIFAEQQNWYMRLQIRPLHLTLK